MLEINNLCFLIVIVAEVTAVIKRRSGKVIDCGLRTATEPQKIYTAKNIWTEESWEEFVKLLLGFVSTPWLT